MVSAQRIYDIEGDRLVVRADNGLSGNHPLVAQLDGTGNPEIVAMSVSRHSMTVWRYDPTAPGNFVIVRADVDINGSLDPTRCDASSAGRNSGGGPPTAGDVNADGVPDIAVAGGVGYAVLDGSRIMDPTVTDPLDLFFWTQDTIDCSSAQTGSSFFDFNGDGRAEVLYADEHTFRIYRGATGDVLFSACNTNGTILEQPIVADIDNDGQADIVVASNARYRECLDAPGTSTSGIRVYSSRDGDWVRTRRVWNQHAYHITNVDEDGTIPRDEAPNWADPALNNFRLNRQPGNQTAAVDAVVSVDPKCTSGFGLFVTVRNLGESVLPAGAIVRVYRGEPMAGVTPPDTDRLVELTTTRALYPAQGERLVVDLTDADQRAILLDGTTGAFAVVEVASGVQECRSDNNTGRLARLCGLL
ncbi:MAG: VCBS repeat-containing protein [Sandaracinaceae bacterium]